MEQALIDALKQFGPAALIIGVPAAWIIRALWVENKANYRTLMDITVKGAVSDMETKNAIDKLSERIAGRGP